MLAALAAVLALPTTGALAAQPAVGLGTAGSFAVLAGAAVTNTGPSVLGGDLGVSPGTAVTGFPPGILNGTLHAADAVAAQAQADLVTAYDDAAGRTPPTAVGADLANRTLTPGVYTAGSALGLTGPLTLDAGGDPSAVFVFQATSTLTTASGSSVNLINGAQPCNVFWQVGSSATLGSSSVFVGTIMALASISMNDAVKVTGRALARTGSVTLINDTITVPRCAAVSPGTTPADGGTTLPGGEPTPLGTMPPTATSTAPPTTGPAAQTGAGPGRGGSASVGSPGPGGGTAALTTLPRSVPTRLTATGLRCVDRVFRAIVTGSAIRAVVFRHGGRLVAVRRRAPFRATVAETPGLRTLTARVTFTDGSARTLRWRFRTCAAAAAAAPRSPSRPPTGRGGFTG